MEKAIAFCNDKTETWLDVAFANKTKPKKDFFQEPSHFRNRQGHRSPRLRLNAVKFWKEPLPFFRRSDGIPCARMTVKKAWATMAKVMCRCHPVHERTS